MELMAGSLADLIGRPWALGFEEAGTYFHHLALALRDIHASAPGAHHGDVKLANLLYRGAQAKLADFGLARGGLGQTEMLGGHHCGTKGYMPPEGFTSQAGDIYSAGVTFLAMIVGKEPDPKIDLRLRMVNRTVAQLIAAMVNPNPRRRPKIDSVVDGATELVAELKDERMRRNSMLALGAAALLAILAIRAA